MPVFKNCEMTMFSADGEWSHPCEVRIGSGSIAVSYEDDGPVVYEGPELEPGHFKLKAVNGRATLHRITDDDILEGSWFEGGYQGMWRIQLDD